MSSPTNPERLVCPTCSAVIQTTKTVGLPDSTTVTCSACKTRFVLGQARIGGQGRIGDPNGVVEEGGGTPSIGMPHASSAGNGIGPDESAPRVAPPQEHIASHAFETWQAGVDQESWFSERTKGFVNEVADALKIKMGVIPPDLAELFHPDDLVYVSYPSSTAKIVKRWLLVLLLLPVLSGVVFHWLGVLFGYLGWGTLAAMPLECLVIVIPFWVLELSWKNTLYIITRDKIILRRGILNRAIKIAWIKNIQEISINSGVVDRWLNLNTIHFATASSAGNGWQAWIPIAALSGISFQHVELKRVLRGLKSVSMH